MNPAMLAYMQQQQQMSQPEGNEEYNPFKNGAMAAMEAARQARRPSEEDNRRAFGKALMSFSSNMAKPTGVEGFGGTLQALNNSFGPAYQAYEGEQQRAVQENAAIMDAIQKEQMLREMEAAKQQQYLMDFEEKKRQHEENLAYKREKEKALQGHRNAQLDEQRLYHLKKLGNLPVQQNLEGEPSAPQMTDGIDINNFASFERPTERNEYLKGRNTASTNLSQLSNIYKKIEKLEKESKGDLISPADPYLSPLANPIKDFIATRRGDKKSLAERNARKDLEASLLKTRTEIEQRARKGPLTEGLARRFEKTGYLKLDNGFDVLKNQIKELMEENERIRRASDLSLKHKKHIMPHDLEVSEESEGVPSSVRLKAPNGELWEFNNPQEAEEARKQLGGEII